jgi:hypothetical protein
MRAIIITIGACILVGGIALAVQHALPMQQNIYSSVPEAGVLWYALGGPTPDRLTWLGADGLLGSFLEQPLDVVLVTAGTGLALIGLSARTRH